MAMAFGRRAGVIRWTLLLLALAIPRRARAEADTFGKGSGRDGALTVTALDTSINRYAALTANAAAGATVLAVDTTAGFAAGNVVLIWQTAGLAAATSGDQTAINLAATNVGHFEFARIGAVAGGSVTLTNPLANAAGYRAGTAQVIQVPEYTTVTIDVGASLVPGQRWNGSRGGAVVFLATGAVINNGVIQADAAGFRGGALVNHAPLNGCSALDDAPAAGAALKGEGVVSSLFNATSGGRGNVANGGGGGVCHNSGGGGGGLAGRGGIGGMSNQGDVPGGPRPVGGLGGAALQYSALDHLSLGGGGGAGDENDSVGSAGAAGGGLVLVRVGNLAGAGTISADGATAGNTTGVGNDAAGGGGAGGAIVVRVAGAGICGGIRANGGAGGNVTAVNRHGPGGGGGGGRVYYEAASGSCTATAVAGLAGQWTNVDSHGAGPATGTDPISVGTVTTGVGAFPGGTCTPAVIGANQCGGCLASTECPASAPACNPGTRQCTACTANFGAAGVGACPTAVLPGCVLTGAQAGACVQCVNNGNCAGNAAGTVCDTAKFTCGACTATMTTGCAATAPQCNSTPANNLCAGCNANFGGAAPLACATAALPVCVLTGAQAGACVQCLVDGDCSAGNWCNNLAGAGVCTPKTPNAQPVPGGACTAPIATRACVSGVCNAADGLCGLPQGGATCTTTTQCRTGVCITSGVNTGRCLICTTDAACAGATPACNTMTNLCVECTASNATRCTGTKPLCNVTLTTCAACTGDAGSGAPNACLAAAPYCAAAGSCGKCTTNAMCVMGVHAGPLCALASGSCGAGCTTDVECGATTRWCDNPTGTTAAGICQPKVANGQPLPGGAPIAGKCTVGNATRTCETATCETGDNRCGVNNGNPCATAAVCRSAICFTDGKCGRPDGQACALAVECRSGTCSLGNCGGSQSDGGADTSAAQPGTDGSADAPGAFPDASVADARAGSGGALDAGAADTGGGQGPAAVQNTIFAGGGFGCDVGTQRPSGPGGGVSLLIAIALAVARRRRRP